MTENDSTFRWRPGAGPDQSAIDRMRRVFSKPSKPMGEAWFMGPERQMYPQLCGDLEALQDDDIKPALQELAAGPSSFGQRDEWTDWFHYLLPHLVVRRWDDFPFHPIETVITAFMSQHPSGAERFPYAGFGSDALRTVGQMIMSPHRWPGGVLHATRCLNKYRTITGTMGWHDARGQLSASLFFCLKYLPEEEVGAWFESVIGIPNPYWTAQILVWLVGAHPLLTDKISQPSWLPENSRHDVQWDWSHALKGNYSGNFESPGAESIFLPAGNRAALLQTVGGLDMTEYFENLLTDPQLEDLAVETVGMPDLFNQLYGGGAG